MSKIHTTQLVSYLIEHKGELIEAYMSNEYFRATHMLIFGGRKIYDTGIDSQEVTRTPEEFIALYPHAYWTIEQYDDED